MLLEDGEDVDCTTIVDDEARGELIREDEDGAIICEDNSDGDDEDAKVDVAAFELTVELVAVEKMLDFVELVEVAAAELLVLVEISGELDVMLLELEDEEGTVVDLVVEETGLELELDMTVDDEDVDHVAVDLEDDNLVEGELVRLDEELEETTRVALKSAPTPAPESVPVAVLKTTLDCVTVGLL